MPEPWPPAIRCSNNDYVNRTGKSAKLLADRVEQVGVVERSMDRADFVQFHHDLKAALLADIPLVGGKGHRLTVSELDNLQQQLDALNLDSHRLAHESNQAMWQVETLPIWYRAALTVFAKTGSMLPVLEGMSVRPLAMRDVARALRWTIIYLFIVATTALVGLCLFDLLVLPAIEYFREDFFLPAATEVSQRLDVLPWLPVMIVLLAIGLVLCLLGMLFGGIANAAPWTGGRRYVSNVVSMTVLRISQSLVEAEVPVDEAVSIGCQLTRAGSNVQREVQSVVQGCEEADAIGQMADCLRLTANNRLARLRIVTPVFLTAILGGVLVLVFCVIVFWPIVSLLKDLLTARVI